MQTELKFQYNNIRKLREQLCVEYNNDNIIILYNKIDKHMSIIKSINDYNNCSYNSTTVCGSFTSSFSNVQNMGFGTNISQGGCCATAFQ